MIDHIFIFSQNRGQEAEELIAFGLKEGSSRRHPGQGTQNRKFYFDNFFLELLWVVDEKELAQGPAKETGLGARAQNQACSPFGICLDRLPDANLVFQDAFEYYPVYFPADKPIEYWALVHACPGLPWVFRLPDLGQKASPSEPGQSLGPLQWVAFEGPEALPAQPQFAALSSLSTLNFIEGARFHLTLDFAEGGTSKNHRFESLPLTFRYE